MQQEGQAYRHLRWLLFPAVFIALGAVWGQDLPAPPKNLKGEAGKDGSVTLTWQASSTSAVAGYNVYEYEPDRQVKINADPLHGTECTVNIPLGSHSYVVRAVAGANPQLLESVDSNKVTVESGKMRKTPIVTHGDGIIDIAKMVNMWSWPEPASNKMKGYNVYLSADGITFGLVNPEPLGNAASYVIKNLEVGKKYYFIFTEVDLNAWEGDASKRVSFTARAPQPREAE